jgi:hypothetical protein
MSDILISEENAYFEPLKKPGYNLYFNTISDDIQGNKYKIIYKNDKNVSDVLSISNSVIFNNIYSHEINENDIPLVEYYNLLIENKSILSLEDNQLKLTSQIEAVQTQPPLLTSSQNNSSLQLYTSPLPFTNSTNRTDDTNQRQPLYIQDDTNRRQPLYIQDEPNIQDEPKKKNLIEKIKERLKKVWGLFTRIFQSKNEKIDIILGEKNTPIENISTEYYSRYPPGYNGPFFKIHAIDKSKENLVEIDDAMCIRLIATKWNTYITTTIDSFNSSQKENFKKTQQEFEDIFKELLEDNHYRNKYWQISSKHIDSYNYDFTNSTMADLNYFDKYREYNFDLYHHSGNDINPIYLEHVNKYGYPLYRAFSKQIDIINKEILKLTISIGGFLQNIINPTQSLSSSITNKYAWDYNSGEITRFNGYYDMSYDRIKINIFEYNDNKNMNIKFSIFSKGDIKTIDNLTTIIILKTSDNKIDPIIVTSKEVFLQDNEDKLENKIIAKISTTTDVDNIYILFDVDIIRNIKDAKIYKEEDKNKYDFLKLNNDLKKIIEYYKAIVNLPYFNFRTYGNIEKQLILFKEVYNNSENLSQKIDKLITIYKEELGLRISICDNILVSSSIDNNIKKNIKKYKELLFYTLQHIDNYPDKKDYCERINKCVPILIDRVRYYGENFIY